MRRVSLGGPVQRHHCYRWNRSSVYYVLGLGWKYYRKLEKYSDPVDIVLVTVSIASFIIGSKYLGQCPFEQNIPIWLVVLGLTGIVNTFLQIMKICTRAFVEEGFVDNDHVPPWATRRFLPYGQLVAETRETPEEKDRRYGNMVANVANCLSCSRLVFGAFTSVWLVPGTVWVFGHWSDWNSASCDAAGSACCHPVPYVYSFAVLMTMVLMMVFIMIAGATCLPAWLVYRRCKE